jgi:hypothetical protein
VEITGWSNEAAKGLLFSDVFKLKSELTGKVVENPVEKVLLTGNIIGLANHTLLINRMGQLVPIADSAAPITDEKGETFGISRRQQGKGTAERNSLFELP